MALISYSLVEKILDIAEAYAADERERLSRLNDEGYPIEKVAETSVKEVDTP